MEGTSWVIQYYKETDRSVREQLLQEGIETEGMTPANELRKKFWDRRYLRQKKDEEKVDHFIKGWVTLRFMENATKGPFSQKRKEKLVREITEDFGFDIAKEAGETGKAMLHMELKNMVKLYVSLCEEDRTYNTILLGFGHMQKDKLERKITRDIYDSVYRIPQDTDTTEIFEPLRKATVEAFIEIYPKCKDVLDAMIEEGIRKEAEKKAKKMK